jgi:hypothetical protein
MTRTINAGDRFNRWTAIETVTGAARIKVRCDCGVESNVICTSLRNNRSKSCGCLRTDLLATVRPGEKFERLTAIGPAGKHGYWRFRCDCGNETTSKLYGVRFGDCKSCGCLREEQRLPETNFGDLFGHLTAIRPAGKNKGGALTWLLKCRCNNEHVATTASIHSGHTTSCGCRGFLDGFCVGCKTQKSSSEFPGLEAGKYNRRCTACVNDVHLKRYHERIKIDAGYVESRKTIDLNTRSRKHVRIHRWFVALELNAAKRGIPFNLTKSDIENIVERQNWICARTGIPFDLTVGKGQRPFGPSIDRVDNSLGYEPGNIEAVCFMYNIAKRNFPGDDVLFFANALVEQSWRSLSTKFKSPRVKISGLV